MALLFIVSIWEVAWSIYRSNNNSGAYIYIDIDISLSLSLSLSPLAMSDLLGSLKVFPSSAASPSYLRTNRLRSKLPLARNLRKKHKKNKKQASGGNLGLWEDEAIAFNKGPRTQMIGF